MRKKNANIFLVWHPSETRVIFILCDISKRETQTCEKDVSKKINFSHSRFPSKQETDVHTNTHKM